MFLVKQTNKQKNKTGRTIQTSKDKLQGQIPTSFIKARRRNNNKKKLFGVFCSRCEDGRPDMFGYDVRVQKSASLSLCVLSK